MWIRLWVIQDCDFETAAALIEKYLLRFYRLHVRPYWPHIEDFQMLIGVNREDQGALWGTTQAAVRPCMFGYEAIGTGRAYATALLSRLHNTGMSLNSASLLAIHVLSCVKEFVGGCGKDTHVIALSGLNVKMVDTTKVAEAERLLKRWFGMDSHLLDYVISATGDTAGLIANAKGLRKELADLDLLK